MDKITTKAPSRGVIDSHMLTTGRTEAFFDGGIDKETIVIKGINYNYGDVVISNDPFIAKIKIKVKKLKLAKNYEREFDSEHNTIHIKQDGIDKDCFASTKLNMVAEKIIFDEPKDLEISLKPKLKGKIQSDETSVVFAGKVCANLTVGVGFCVVTNGIIEQKKSKLKITGATKVELSMKLVTGFNPISKVIELDVNKVLQSTRDQIYLLESELYDVIKMKHLMEVDKHKLGE